MGQKASTVREFTPDTKPPKKENNFSFEKPKNKNEDSKLKPREIYIGHKKTKKDVNVSNQDKKTDVDFGSPHYLHFCFETCDFKDSLTNYSFWLFILGECEEKIDFQD